MGDDMVGVGHLGEVRAGGTGLLAGLPSHRTTGLAVRALFLGGLGKDVRAGRQGRVLRAAPELLFELGDGASQHVDLLFELRDLVSELSPLRCLLLGKHLQRCDELLQLFVGGLVSERGGVVGRNSPRYARCTRRWEMVHSEHVNGYSPLQGQRADPRSPGGASGVVVMNTREPAFRTRRPDQGQRAFGGDPDRISRSVMSCTRWPPGDTSAISDVCGSF